MGEVYRARDPSLGREVALKVLPEEVSPDRDRLARFEQEARVGLGLEPPQHRHDLRDRPVGIGLLHRDGARGRARRCGRSAVERPAACAADLLDRRADRRGARQGARGRDRPPRLEARERHGVEGRLRQDPRLRPGQARRAGLRRSLGDADARAARDASGHGPGHGRLHVARSRRAGEPVDFRSDQFSLGSILYEIAAGEKAFRRRPAAETMSAIIREEPEPLGQAPPGSAAAPALDHRALPGQGSGGALRLHARPRAGSRRRAGSHLRGRRAEPKRLAVAAPRGKTASPAAPAGRGLLAGALTRRRRRRPGSPRKRSAAPSFHRLTFRHGTLDNARFAPDGQTILYGATWEGEPSRGSTRRAPRARSPDRLTSEPTAPTSWRSPLPGRWRFSSTRLGYRRGPRARPDHRRDPPRECSRTSPYAGADWAPDGKDLVVIAPSGRKQRLEYPIGTGRLTPGDAGSPRFSPNGRLDRLLRRMSATQAVSVVDPSGKKPQDPLARLGRASRERPAGGPTARKSGSPPRKRQGSRRRFMG